MYRRLLLLPLLLALFTLTGVGQAAPLDNAANKKIDEAINQHYLATDFKKAEGVLLGTIKACGDRCSNPVLARAWMYVGIVRGSGQQNQQGALEAFQQALAIDPEVQLDQALATPETRATFESAGAAVGVDPQVGAPEPPAESAIPGVAGEDVPGEMQCTPDVQEVETRRPIPVSCISDEDITSAELRYKEFGGESWKTVRMRKNGDDFQAEIPCSATTLVGTLRFFVRGKDASGDTVDSFGTKTKPATIEIVSQTGAPPPAYPGQSAPQRCAEKVICPPGMEDSPECKAGQQSGGAAWGAPCSSTSECNEGLTCQQGTCETAQSCDVDADCSAGSCVGGVCQEEKKEAAGPFKKNWIGLHVAQDFAMVSGTDVCSPQNVDQNFVCFEAGRTDVQFVGIETVEGAGGNIPSGTALATTRILASYERAFGENITLGARLGYAFNGGPKALGGTPFLPLHAEARASFYFLGLTKAFRPYVHVGGGVAQVDTKVADVQVQRVGSSEVEVVDAWKKMGQSFVTGGAGIAFGFTENIAAKLNFNFVYLLPDSGVSLQPSLGLAYGF